MIWMEMRNNLDQVKEAIETALSERYQAREKSENNAFHTGKVFHTDQYGDVSLCVMGNEEPWNFFVIEYDNGEDGDSFYPSDYDNFEDLVADVISEIES